MLLTWACRYTWLMQMRLFFFFASVNNMAGNSAVCTQIFGLIFLFYSPSFRHLEVIVDIMVYVFELIGVFRFCTLFFLKKLSHLKCVHNVHAIILTCKPFVQSVTRVKPYICTMPLKLDDGWNNIQLNLADLTKRAYGTNYVETLRVQVHANCRLRRIYFSDRLYSEEELPPEFKLYLPIQVRTPYFVTLL